MVLRVLSQHLLFGSLCIAGLYRIGEVVQIGARLANEFETPNLSVPRMDRRHPIFGKRFEFLQAREPAFKVSFLQIEVRLIVDQVRREKRFRSGNVESCDMLALAFAKFHNLEFDTLQRQNMAQPRPQESPAGAVPPGLAFLAASRTSRDRQS